MEIARNFRDFRYWFVLLVVAVLRRSNRAQHHMLVDIIMVWSEWKMIQRESVCQFGEKNIAIAHSHGRCMSDEQCIRPEMGPDNSINNVLTAHCTTDCIAHMRISFFLGYIFRPVDGSLVLKHFLFQLHPTCFIFSVCLSQRQRRRKCSSWCVSAAWAVGTHVYIGRASLVRV